VAEVITFYNNKGGVSKTTTLFNLGVYLSMQGKKVLLADCDPQCNATELFFASSEALDDPAGELPGTSIYQALKPRLEGEVGRIDVSNTKLVQSPLYNNLYLLRGDLEFSLAESYFANAVNLAITENIHEKNTYISLYRLIQDLISRHNFDYVLCDVGPSTGAITRMTVLACDGFFLPLHPDRFSNQAVRVLSSVLKEWTRKHTEILKTFEPFKVRQFPGNPALLGVVIQNFKVHRGDKVKKSYLKWQETIQATVRSSLLSNGITISPKLNQEHPFVANIKEVGPLAPVAQMFGRAIFDIRQEDTTEASTTGGAYYGAVWQGWEERKSDYRAEISKIAEKLLA